MVWDLAIIWLMLSFAVAGWNLGIVNAWPAPVAILLATAITQLFYGNFSAWLIHQLNLPGVLAFFLGYLLLWLALEVAIEYTLMLLFPIRKRLIIGPINRGAGAIVGFGKAFIVLVFAAASSVTAQQVTFSALSGPPIASFIRHHGERSQLIRHTAKVAASMPAALAAKVIASDAPTYAPEVVAVDDRSNISGRNAEDYGMVFRTLREIAVELSVL